MLLTGAAGGIGRQFVDQLLERQVRRVYAASRSAAQWQDDRVVTVRMDVNEPADVALARAALTDVDVLINNAGILGGRGGILETPLQETRKLFETNVFGQISVAQAFAPTIVANGGGVIVNILSALSWLGTGPYAASKAAFWSVSNALRTELLPHGVRVVGAHFGYTDTPMIDDMDVPKQDPHFVVESILDGIEEDKFEVLVDLASAALKAGLSGSLTDMYPELLSTAEQLQ